MNAAEQAAYDRGFEMGRQNRSARPIDPVLMRSAPRLVLAYEQGWDHGFRSNHPNVDGFWRALRQMSEGE